MRKERSNPFTFAGFQALVQRNILPGIITMALCCCLSLLVMFYVPSVYQSSVTASIPSTYFKNPIVNDVMPEITDTGEIETQKRTLLKRALSDDLIDAIGEKYGLFDYPLDDPRHPQERKKLLGQIKYSPIDSSTFRITVSAPSATVAQDVLHDVIDKLRFTLIEERFTSFTQARNAIAAEIDSLDLRASAKQKAEIEALRTELEAANQVIGDLREKYTESHPELYQMQKRAQELRDQILGKESDTQHSPRTSREDEASVASSTSLYTELTRKLTFLSVALSIEKGKQSISFLNIIEEPELPVSPIYPRALSFLQYGFGVGLLVVLVQTIYLEIRRSQFFEPQEVAEVLGVPFFGIMPQLQAREWGYLIEQASMVRAQRLLPPPS